MGGKPLSREVLVGPGLLGSAQHRSVLPFGVGRLVRTQLWRHVHKPAGSSGPTGSLVSRHLPDGEFGWGGISVTQQRRCPKASSVGTEISRRTQASRLA